MADSNRILADKRFTFDPTIEADIKIASDLIRSQLQEFGEEGIAISFNGGKDCTLLLGLLDQCITKESQIQGFYCKTGETFQEIQDFIGYCEQRFPFLKLNSFDLPIKESLQEFLNKYPKIKGILIGNRRSDPNSGHLQLTMQTDHDWPQVLRIHPLLDWSYSQVWNGIYYLELAYCSLYDQGYTSLGDSKKTLKNKSLSLSDCDLPAYLLKDGRMERQGR